MPEKKFIRIAPDFSLPLVTCKNVDCRLLKIISKRLKGGNLKKGANFGSHENAF